MRVSGSRTTSTIAGPALLAILLGPVGPMLTRPAFAAGQACDVVIYEDGDFEGERQEITTTTPYVGDHWSDRISSIRVLSGHWRFFKESAFAGDDMLSFGPGDYPRIPLAWNDRIRSLRCLDEQPGRSPPMPIAAPPSQAAPPRPTNGTRAVPDVPGGGEDFRSLGHEERFDGADRPLRVRLVQAADEPPVRIT